MGEYLTGSQASAARFGSLLITPGQERRLADFLGTLSEDQKILIFSACALAVKNGSEQYVGFIQQIKSHLCQRLPADEWEAKRRIEAGFAASRLLRNVEVFEAASRVTVPFFRQEHLDDFVRAEVALTRAEASQDLFNSENGLDEKARQAVATLSRNRQRSYGEIEAFIRCGVLEARSGLLGLAEMRLAQLPQNNCPAYAAKLIRVYGENKLPADSLMEKIIIHIDKKSVESNIQRALELISACEESGFLGKLMPWVAKISAGLGEKGYKTIWTHYAVACLRSEGRTLANLNSFLALPRLASGNSLSRNEILEAAAQAYIAESVAELKVRASKLEFENPSEEVPRLLERVRRFGEY